VTSEDQPFSQMEASLKKAAAALREAGIPFLLGGSLASWARGGPETTHDLDFMLKPEDAERALEVLCAAGMTAERPPEEWLYKAYDGDVMIDVIFAPTGMPPVTRELIDGAEELSVLAIRMPVMSIEDVLASKLLVLSEQRLDYAPVVEIARALRERIDWPELIDRTSSSPYARAFFALLRELDVLTAG